MREGAGGGRFLQAIKRQKNDLILLLHRNKIKQDYANVTINKIPF